jgi:hypothetical protein
MSGGMPGSSRVSESNHRSRARGAGMTCMLIAALLLVAGLGVFFLLSALDELPAGSGPASTELGVPAG